jgi:hypothetical protein
MSRAEIIGQARELVYGSGTGERPSIRRAAAAASVTVSGSIATFTLLAGEGAKVKAGDILSFLSDGDATKAYVFYVLSVSTDTVTALNGYRGSPAITNASADLNSGAFEQNPLVTNSELQSGVDTVFGMLLWPQVFKFGSQQITPDLSSMQAELEATCMEILSAQQLNAGIAYDIPHGRVIRNLDTDVSSTGVMANFAFINGSTCYLTTKEKFVVGDEDSYSGLHRLVATGVAALALGASISETALEPGNKESDGASRQTPGNILWRDFLNLRSAWSLGIAREAKLGFIIRRPG